MTSLNDALLLEDGREVSSGGQKVMSPDVLAPML